MKALGQLEAVVMQRLWAASDPLTVRDVLEDLTKGRHLAYTTVMTVMDNLHGKGLVRRHKEGRAYLYTATLTREEHAAGLLDDVLAASADRSATLMHFVGHLSDKDVAELRALLDSHDDPRGA
ncbi:MAG: BlaI/MecI/CopY family transcriptional regulator [Propionibacteriaceae bacterium]